VGVKGVSDPRQAGVFIWVDSAAWFTWLEAAETRGFTYALEDEEVGYIVGWMTVRKEGRERGGLYWRVYRREGKQVRKVYIGASEKVTGTRLKEVAELLRMPSGSRVEQEA
jgi:hypothetical protein